MSDFDPKSNFDPHLEPPPLSEHRWCIWSQCRRRSVWDPEISHQSGCLPHGHMILDINQTRHVSHHVNKQLPQRLPEKWGKRIVSYETVRGKCRIKSPTLPSALAHRSHTAFRTAALARWITPFSGPNWCIQGSKNISVRIQMIKEHWRCLLITSLCLFQKASPYPSQLALTGQESVKSTKVADDLLPGHPNHQFGQCLNGTHHCWTGVNRNDSTLTSDTFRLLWRVQHRLLLLLFTFVCQKAVLWFWQCQ